MKQDAVKMKMNQATARLISVQIFFFLWVQHYNGASIQLMKLLPKLSRRQQVVLPLFQVLELEIKTWADHTTLQGGKNDFNFIFKNMRAIFMQQDPSVLDFIFPSV